MSNHQHNLATYDMLFRTVRPAPISGMKTATLGVAASIRSEAKPAPPETNFDGVCVINKNVSKDTDFYQKFFSYPSRPISHK